MYRDESRCCPVWRRERRCCGCHSSGLRIVRTALVEEMEPEVADPDDCADGNNGPNHAGSRVVDWTGVGVHDSFVKLVKRFGNFLIRLNHGALLIYLRLELDFGLQTMTLALPQKWRAPLIWTTCPLPV